MKKRILYGIANYAELVEKNGYFVDKTHWLAELEMVNNPVFLRPRRFGKSLLCSILGYYYDLNMADRFSELFRHTWIGEHPTDRKNSCFILSLDFSVIEPGKNIEDIERSFKVHCNYLLKYMRNEYPLLQNMPEIKPDEPVSDCLGRLLSYIKKNNLPPLYVIIDEYDNFANQLVTANKDQLYRELTADNSFFKTFFKILKEGRKRGTIANVFITGVLPITMDDMASGFNVATFLTLDPQFESMLGFTQAETDTLVDAVFQDQDLDLATRSEVGTLMKNQYNGYQLVTNDGESLYNSTSVLYFLNWLQNHKTMPKHLTDLNLKTDISWVRRLTASNPALTEEFVDRLT
ncbi:MAG: AAA family ATPase, partial [Candidatus Electrothrix sp. AR5]|nr:AAA family ATPase [Candidatus Electrothrix sp. AR5]